MSARAAYIAGAGITRFDKQPDRSVKDASLAQLHGEAGSRQVDNARFSIAENGGGFNGVEEAATCITILGR